MKKQLKMVIIVSTLILTAWGINSFGHSAHFTKSTRSAEQSYDFRSSTMSVYKWYLSPMGAMVKGKVDFNTKKFAYYANGLETISKLGLLEGFPKDSNEEKVEDSSAKAIIWSNWKDFEKKYNAFQREAKSLAIVSKSGNEATMKAQFKITADTCVACHKTYKTK